MFEQALADLDVDKFWRDGFAILPDAYTDDEVEQMRRQVSAHCGSGGGELATSPLRHVLTDGKMAAVAGKLLGTDQILYGGDSSATINGKIRAWHKDNTDRLDRDAPDWDDRYTQLRFGIYLQDHTAHTGGLNVKVGSHDICDLETGETTYLKNSPRDLLVWSMRITHSGAGTLLKDPEARFPEPNEWNAFPDNEIAPAHDERMAIFAHIGADDKHGRRYLDYLKTRTYMVNAWRSRPFTDEIRAELADAGFVVRDMPSEVKDDKRAGRKKDWEPFWYMGMPQPEPETKIVYRDRPVPAAAQQSFTQRYGRAVKRRLRGVAGGALEGWRGAAPKGKR
ncbi:hypothetical protein [Flexivirga meconopsidis]|uniref:hypothetical protein n=1 Tax=Flexivirga meconopsidis TaxID=2977121 RepID=UPI0022402C65|nr:hypothetical protein [Flexivirga meconopsidis]